MQEGELLATLENSDLAAAALDNKGSYTAAQATYDTATKATVAGGLAKAKLDLAQAKANLDLSQSIVNARTELFTQGAIPGRDLDTAKAALVQAQAAYDIAKQHLESLQKVSNKAALENAQGNLDSAKGKYLGAEAQLSYTEIRSPIDGVVTDRPLFAGETAAAGTPLLTVMDTSALIAKLHIAQMQAQQLAARRAGDAHRSRRRRSGSREGLAHQPGARSRQHHGRGVAARGKSQRHAQGRHSGPRHHHRPHRSRMR